MAVLVLLVRRLRSEFVPNTYERACRHDLTRAAHRFVLVCMHWLFSNVNEDWFLRTSVFVLRESSLWEVLVKYIFAESGYPQPAPQSTLHRGSAPVLQRLIGYSWLLINSHADVDARYLAGRLCGGYGSCYTGPPRLASTLSRTARRRLNASSISPCETENTIRNQPGAEKW